MTKNFDTLLESMLSEMAYTLKASTDKNEEATKARSEQIKSQIVDNILNAEGAGHWANALNKLKKNPKAEENVKEVVAKAIDDLFNIILPDKHNTENKKQEATKNDLLKDGGELEQAINTVISMNKTHNRFLKDRLKNKTLLGQISDVIEGAEGGGIRLAPEATTQKQDRAQIKKTTDEFNSPEGQKARLERSSQKRQSIASTEFSLTNTYELKKLNDREIGSLDEDQKDLYDALYDEATGKDLRDAGKEALPGSRFDQIEQMLQKFLTKGIITIKEEESTGEDDFEKGGSGEITPGVNEDDLENIAGSFDDTINSFGSSRNQGRNQDEY